MASKASKTPNKHIPGFVKPDPRKYRGGYQPNTTIEQALRQYANPPRGGSVIKPARKKAIAG